jgi:hypothetical protein
MAEHPCDGLSPDEIKIRREGLKQVLRQLYRSIEILLEDVPFKRTVLKELKETTYSGPHPMEHFLETTGVEKRSLSYQVRQSLENYFILFKELQTCHIPANTKVNTTSYIRKLQQYLTGSDKNLSKLNNSPETIAFLKNELQSDVNSHILRHFLEGKSGYRSKLIIHLLNILVRRYKAGHKEELFDSALLQQLSQEELVRVEQFLRDELETAEEFVRPILINYLNEILKQYIEIEAFEAAEAFLRKDYDQFPEEQNSLRPLLLSVLERQKKYTNMAYVLKENYQDKKQKLTLPHQITQKKLKDFITFLMKTEQYTIAEAFLEKEIAIERGAFEIEQFSLLLNLLADIFMVQKKYDRAEEVLQELFYIHIELIRKTVGLNPINLERYPALKDIRDRYKKSFDLQEKDPRTKATFEVQLAKAIGSIKSQYVRPDPTTRESLVVATTSSTSNASRGVVSRSRSLGRSIQFVPNTEGTRSTAGSMTKGLPPGLKAGTVKKAEKPVFVPQFYSGRSRSGSRSSGPLTTSSRGGGTKKAPSSRRMTKSLCPSGQVLRFGSTRKSKKSNRRTRKVCGPGIGKLKEGQLAKFGYSDVVHKTVEARRAALDNAVKEFGPLSVFRKLNAVYVYGRRSAKESSKIFKEDRDWVKSKYM